MRVEINTVATSMATSRRFRRVKLSAKRGKPRSVKKRVSPKSYRLKAEPGEFHLTGGAAELIVRRAQEVEAAMALLPAGALHANREDAIRRNLSVVTDGAVGGHKVAVKRKSRRATKRRAAKAEDRRPKKSSAVKSLRRIARDLTNKATAKMAEQAGTAAWVALAEALKRLVEVLTG